MKIKVRTKDAKFTLILPTALLSSRLIVSMALYSTKDTIHFDKTQVEKLTRLLKGIRKEYKGLRLVDVQTAEGEIVQITL